MNYFEMSEFECKCGCGKRNIDEGLLLMLDEAREESGIPYIITSGCRCKKHNARVGGRKNSSHLSGLAVDIKATDSRARFRIVTGLLLAGFARIGIGKRFIHADADGRKPSPVIYLY